MGWYKSGSIAPVQNRWHRRHSKNWLPRLQRRPRRWAVLFSGVLIITLLANLGFMFQLPAADPVDLRQLYSRSAQYEGPQRNPVILIPGLVGSALTTLKREPVWGQFSLTSDFTRTALPLQPGLAANQDLLKPDRVLPSLELNIFGWRLEQEAYRQILDALGAIGGYRDSLMGRPNAVDYDKEHFTCFQFPYDWRQDNVSNAQHLHTFILEKQAYLRQQYQERFGIDNAEIKFDIVAHSMGGLLTRYFLRYGDRDLPDDGPLPPVTWAGTRYVDHVILIGPPNAGSLDILVNLLQGSSLRAPNFFSQPLAALARWLGHIGIGPAEPHLNRAVLGTFPSVYQMIPRQRHQPAIAVGIHPASTSLNLFDITLWERMQWGLLSPQVDGILQRLLPDIAEAGERHRIAHEYLTPSLKRAERFTQALDQPAPPPQTLNLELLAGDGIPTAQTIGIDAAGNIRVLKYAAGDGTVLRSSALLDERAAENWTPRLQSPIPWKRVSFYGQDHVRLTQEPSLINNLLFTLLEEPGLQA